MSKTKATSAAAKYETGCKAIRAAVAAQLGNTLSSEGISRETSAEMGARLAALFPQRDPEFGMVDGKAIRVSAKAPMAYLMLWSAVHGDVATLDTGKVVWSDDALAKGTVKNYWSAVLMYVRGEIREFSWNGPRQRAAEEKAAKAGKGENTKRTPFERVLKRLNEAADILGNAEETSVEASTLIKRAIAAIMAAQGTDATPAKSAKV